jgi:alpha-tubulin suppressor-like RCC1 family protein
VTGTDKELLERNKLSFIKITNIASGSNHCLALSETNKVYSWGNGQGGKLGHGDKIGKSIPTRIKALDDINIIQIECGDVHSGCLTDTFKLYTWGVGLNGRLG